MVLYKLHTGTYTNVSDIHFSIKLSIIFIYLFSNSIRI